MINTCFENLFMVYLENTTKHRFYLLFVQQDLFEVWCLVRSFGSLLNRRGRTMFDVCENEMHALESLSQIENKKLKRGYVHADLPHSEHFYLRPQNAKEFINSLKPNKPIKQPVTIESDEKQFNPNQNDLF